MRNTNGPLRAILALCCAGLVSGACQSEPQEKPSTDVVARYYQEVWNDRKIDILEDLVAADFVDRGPSNPQLPGLKGFRQRISKVQEIYVNIAFTIHEMAVEEDRVTARWTFDAITNLNAPRLTLSDSEKWRVVDGKIKERWGDYDLQALAREGKSTAFSEETNTATVRRYYEDVWNRNQPALMDILFAPDFVDHSPDSGQSPDLEGFKASVESFRGRFRNPEFTIEKLGVAGQKVQVNWKYKGSFMGLVDVNFQGVEVWAVRGSRIKERWAEYDQETFIEQVGQ